MSIFSRELFDLDEAAVQYRLHVTPHRRQRVWEAVLFQVPGPVGERASTHLCQRIDTWVFDSSPASHTRSIDGVLEHIVEASLQRRIPGIG